MCTPSRREAHIGQKRVPGERESRRIAENYKHMQRHTLLKMCTPSRPEAHFGVMAAPGERQSRRYAELFVVALKGLAGTTLANQGRSHEARGLVRDGQRGANHDGRLSFHKKTLKSCVLNKCTPSRREAHFGEERVPGERQSRRIAENYKQLQKHTPG